MTWEKNKIVSALVSSFVTIILNAAPPSDCMRKHRSGEQILSRAPHINCWGFMHELWWCLTGQATFVYGWVNSVIRCLFGISIAGLHAFIHVVNTLLAWAGEIPKRSARSSFSSPKRSLIKTMRNSSCKDSLQVGPNFAGELEWYTQYDYGRVFDFRLVLALTASSKPLFYILILLIKITCITN